MGRYTYLVAAFICLIGWIVLDNIYSDFKWIALGLAMIMVVFAFATKEVPKHHMNSGCEDEDEGVAEDLTDDEIDMNIALDGGVADIGELEDGDLNEIGGHKNDI